jgi:O-antigen/teichoic acid export membrane protein
LHSNWPLGGAAAIVSLLTYTPRFALAWAHGEVPVGEYAALGQVALLGNLAVQGAGQASLARLGVGFIQSRQDFARHVVELLVLASAVALVGGVAATLWGGAVLAWLFQPRFGSLSGALVGMMVASAFVYSTSVFGYALTAAGVKRAQIAIFGTALLVGGIAAFPLCAGYGLGGAIASSILSWAVATALSGTLLYRLCGRRPTGVRTVAHGVREGGAV